MWSSSHIDEIISSLVWVCTCLFHIEKHLNAEEDRFVVDNMAETLMITTEEKTQVLNNERVLEKR